MSRSAIRRDGAHQEPGRTGASRTAGASPASHHEAILSLQRSAGNAAVSGLVRAAAGDEAAHTAPPWPLLLQREVADAAVEPGAGVPGAEVPTAGEDTDRFDLDAVADDEEGPTVQAFDAVGLEIYVLAPLRRALARVEEQEWEDAEALFLDTGAALIEFFDHYTAAKPVLAEKLLSYKNYLGTLYTHIRYRLGHRAASDGEIAAMLDGTIRDLEAEQLPAARPEAASDLMRPGDEEPGEAAREGEPGSVRLFDQGGLEIYVLAPLRRLAVDVERQEWEAAQETFGDVGRALLEFYEHYLRTEPAVAERLLNYKNFLGIAYTHIGYRLNSFGPSDDELTRRLAVTLGELETLGAAM